MSPTYSNEIDFTLNASNRAAPYNTAETPGGIRAGTGLLYAAFQVDMNLPASPDQLRFDLYSERMLEGDIAVES